MTDNGINQKVTELKTQVAALEQLLATDEQAVIEQADKLEQALAALQEAVLQLPDVPAETALSPQSQPGMFVENSPVVLFRWRAAEGWPVEYVSENVTQFGYTSEELLTGEVPFVSVVHPDDLERVGREVADYSANGPDTFHQEYRIITKSGEVRWTDDWTEIKRDAAGRITHYQGIVFDITDRKQSELGMRESEVRFRSAFEYTMVGMALVNTGGGFLRVNSALCEMLGYTEAELLSLNFQAVTHPDDMEMSIGYLRQVVAGEIDAFQEEKRYIHKFGHVVWVQISVAVVRADDGQPQYFISQIQNITQRKQAEESLRAMAELQQAIVDNAEYAIISTTVDGIITTFNPAAERMLGYTTAEVVGQETPAILHVPTEVRERARVFSKELGITVEPGFEVFVAKARQNLPNRYEWTYIRKDGSRFPVLLAITTLRDAEDNITGFLGIAQDITEQKQSENALQRERALLHSLIDSVPDMISYKDRAGIYLGCNMAFAEFVGRSESDLVGQSDFDLFPTDVAEFFREQDQVMMAEKQVHSNEEWVDYPDGRRVLLDILKTPFYDTEGEVIGLIGISRDITERRQAEEERARLSTILEATSDFVGMVDAKGQSLYVNKAGREMIGIGLDEDITSLPIAAYHPERVLPFMLEKAIPTAVQEGLWNGENVLLSRNGKEISVLQVLIAQKSAKGEVEYFATIARDITEQKQTQKLLTKRASELEAVAQVSTAASTILDTGRLLQQVADLTKERFNLYHAHIYLLAEQGDTLNLTAGAGQVGQQMAAEGWSIPLEREQSLVARVARNGQGVIVNDVQAEPGFMPNPLLPDTRSEMAVPMLVGDRVVGVLDVQADVVDRFTQEDVQITTTLAAQVAIALENANLLQQTQAALSQTEEQAQRLAQLSQMSAQLNLATTEADIFKVASERTPNIVPSDRASVALLAETGDSLEVLALQGKAGAVPIGASLPIEGTGLGRAVQEKQLVNTPDTQGSDLIDINMMAQQGIRSTLSVPLVIGGQAIGTLNVGSMRAQAYDLRDENMMWQVGALLASALENRRLLQQTETALADVQQSQELLRSVIDTTPDWIFIKDREHRYRLVNQSYADAMHLTLQEMIGKNDLEIGFPEDMVKGNPDKGIRGFWADDTEVMDRGEMKFIEVEPAMVDGQPVFLNTIKVPLRDAESQVWGVLGFVHDITNAKQTEESLAKRAKELSCLNDLGREMEGAPSLPELLQWTTERVPPAMQHPELCAVAIEYDEQVYGMPQAVHLPSQMTHGLYVGSEIVGRVYIAYTEKHDFLNEESALLGGVATRLGGYIENRRLLEQVQLRARREQILREVTDRIRGSVEVETIMRTAAQEVGQVLGRPAFVYLGNGEKSPSAAGEPQDADSQ